MYTIILVDDEAEIREGIIKKIKWEEYGFQIVGSAENGKEALELVERLTPDVVMTDIMMPFMDGLELGEELVKKYPLTKLIIFSGFDDLEYAHKAIKLNVVEYVLKPVNANDMGETLSKLKAKLDEEHENRTNLEVLRKHYIDSMPVIKEQVLVGLLEGRVTKDDLERNSGLIGMDVNSPHYVVGLLQVDKNLSNDSETLFKNHNDVLITTTLKQLSEEVIDKYYKATCFLYGNLVGFIFDMQSKDQIYKIINGMNEICIEARKIYGLCVSGGIGNIINNPMDMYEAKNGAISALEYRVAIGNGKTIYIHDVEPDTSINIRFSGVDESKLTSAIKLGNKEDINNVIHDIVSRFSDSLLSLDQYKLYFMEIKISFLHLVQTYGLRDLEVYRELEAEMNAFNTPASINAFKEWLIEKSIKISNQIKKERVNSSTLLVDKAKEYVEENYSDFELTVENLSNELHVSPTYFSTIFKRETGSNFIAYLTEVRLQKAIEFLNTTDDKSYIIAEKVGYAEPNYFSYVFKKKFGVSPSKYRKK